MGITKPACALMVHDVQARAQPAGATVEAKLSIPLEQLLDVVEGLRSRGYRFVPVREFVARRREGGVALLTFDDGYRSLLEVGARLAEEHIPALCFLVSGSLASRSDCFPLWLFTLRDHWGELPEKHRRELEAHPAARAVVRARGCTSLEELLAGPAAGLYTIFYPRLSYGQIDALREVVETAGLPKMTLEAEEVVALHASGALEFGAHSVHHHVLPHLSRAVVRQEVFDCCTRIAALLGCETRDLAFSYPYGQATPAARRAVRERCLAGFITGERTISRFDPDELLPRVEVDDTVLARIDAAPDSPRLRVVARERWDLYARVVLDPLRRLKRRTGKLGLGTVEAFR